MQYVLSVTAAKLRAVSSLLCAGWSSRSRPDTCEAKQFPVLTPGTLSYTVRVRTPSTFHPTIAQVRGEVEHLMKSFDAWIYAL